MARHVLIDATGIKVYSEGEWKTRQYGASKRRTWRKFHLAVDEATGEILAAEVSGNDKKDSQLLDALLEQIPAELAQVSADGAYAQRNASVAIPPRQDAKIWQHGNCKRPPHPRDENLRLIRKHGRAKWKRLSNYHRRSLAETTLFRFKTIFTDKAAYRRLCNQVTELKLKAKALNLIAMPDSYRLASRSLYKGVAAASS